MNTKIMLLLIHLLTVSGFQVIKSQNDAEYIPFISENKTWSVTYNSCWNPPESQTFYTKTFAFFGDSIINDTVYKKLYETRSEANSFVSENWNLSYNELWREDIEAKQVWQRKNQREVLIYDFSLNVGDTIDFHYHGEDITILIDSIGFITMNDGDERRVFHLGYDMMTGMYECIIEGIGSNLGITDAYTRALVGETTDLLCFKENQDLIFINSYYNTCYRKSSTTNVDTQYFGNNFEIYPNPVESTIYLQSENNNIKSVSLINIGGQILKEFYTNISKIDVTDLPAGVYLLKVYYDNTYVTKKIVIENN
ncbi:T9SS type A sorting domain-containing protein [Bacteroidales bacterium OttesenSCG-928-I21]|nr:T9SS type A sorting domain-containing protein [Bacteroidales bacterium OttesenSCG-928-I21]